jgi:hypothetical protein
MSDVDPSEYASRVTVDLDGDKYDVDRFEQVAVRAYHNLEAAADAVEVAVSSSGEGLHLIGWFREDLHFSDEVKIRRTHHDDPRRVDMDCQRWLEGLYTDVLFSSKHGRDATQTRYATIWDALETIRHNRTDDVDRVRRLAVDGHKGAPSLARRAD